MDFPKSVPGVGLVADRYVNEDPNTGRQGTLVTAEALNAITDELLNIIRAAGIEPNEAAHDQLAEALERMYGGEDVELRLQALEQFKARVPGVDSVWVDKTSSRAFGATYTNGPVAKEISIMGQSTVAGAVFQFLLYIDGKIASAANSYASAANTGNSLTRLIPAYAKYRVDNNLNAALSRWEEMEKV